MSALPKYLCSSHFPISPWKWRALNAISRVYVTELRHEDYSNQTMDNKQVSNLHSTLSGVFAKPNQSSIYTAVSQRNRFGILLQKCIVLPSLRFEDHEIYASRSKGHLLVLSKARSSFAIFFCEDYKYSKLFKKKYKYALECDAPSAFASHAYFIN